MLVLGECDLFSKHKHCALDTSVTRLRCTARLTQKSTVPWCLFYSTSREICSTNIALGHSPLEETGKKHDEEEAQFDCFDGSCIRGFGNARHQGYGKTRWRNPLSETR